MLQYIIAFAGKENHLKEKYLKQLCLCAISDKSKTPLKFLTFHILSNLTWEKMLEVSSHFCYSLIFFFQKSFHFFKELLQSNNILGILYKETAGGKNKILHDLLKWTSM